MIPTQLLRQYRLPWHVEEMRHNFGLVILDELFHRPLLWWCKFMSALTRAAAYKALLNWPINRVILSCVDTVLSTPRKNLMLKRRAVELLLVDAGCLEHSDRFLDAFLHYAILSIDFRSASFRDLALHSIFVGQLKFWNLFLVFTLFNIVSVRRTTFYFWNLIYHVF